MTIVLLGSCPTTYMTMEAAVQILENKSDNNPKIRQLLTLYCEEQDSQ